MGQEDKEVILLSKRGYFTLSLYALCLGVERKHFQEICISTMRLVWPRPITKIHAKRSLTLQFWYIFPCHHFYAVIYNDFKEIRHFFKRLG